MEGEAFKIIQPSIFIAIKSCLLREHAEMRDVTQHPKAALLHGNKSTLSLPCANASVKFLLC